ncbi:hypothetical protein BD413DRAFT_142432 [Trametes elegans]|nr:hypothetical protein BD413DRAFT_142432 [Trametes elegans]
MWLGEARALRMTKGEPLARLQALSFGLGAFHPDGRGGNLCRATGKQKTARAGFVGPRRIEWLWRTDRGEWRDGEIRMRTRGSSDATYGQEMQVSCHMRQGCEHGRRKARLPPNTRPLSFTTSRNRSACVWHKIYPVLGCAGPGPGARLTRLAPDPRTPTTTSYHPCAPRRSPCPQLGTWDDPPWGGGCTRDLTPERGQHLDEMGW